MHQHDEELRQQNQQIHLNEAQIESFTKELHDLDICSLTAREELQQQRAQLDYRQTQLKLLTQKLHKIKMDEKPITNEILHDEKQLGRIRTTHLELHSHRKENLTRIQKYQSNITELMVRVKHDDHRLAQETSALQHCNHQIHRSSEISHTLDQDLKSAEANQQYLKDIAKQLDEEAIGLKQQHGELKFLVELIERRYGDQQRHVQDLYRMRKHQIEEYQQRGRYAVSSHSFSNSRIARSVTTVYFQ
jgi:chromosome segregation ATPase